LTPSEKLHLWGEFTFFYAKDIKNSSFFHNLNAIQAIMLRLRIIRQIQMVEDSKPLTFLPQNPDILNGKVFFLLKEDIGHIQKKIWMNLNNRDLSIILKTEDLI
jgi:hypothetical protein